MRGRVVALGPGEAELIPSRALEVLRGLGRCALVGDSGELEAALTAAGVVLDPHAPLLAAPDAAALLLARERDLDTIPERRLLERQATAAAAGTLRELTARLRRECPWDRAQDASSIVPHTVEEAYEVADAVQADGLSARLVDELGDLLFQTSFLALLCEEAGVGDWQDVIEQVTGKLVRRHPHVFGEDAAATAGEVKGLWEQRKRSHEQREGIFHDIPASLPGLGLAAKTQRRAASVGFEYPQAEGAFADLRSELLELERELAGLTEPAPELPAAPRVVAELGDLLLAAVNVARRWNCDPELALRAATHRFRSRVELAERLARDDGVAFAEAGLADQELYYQRAKARLRKDEPE